jgi:hypothetical protein
VTSVGLSELRAASQRRIGEIDRELAEAKELVDRHGAERRKLELARRQALSAAAAAMLPALAPEGLRRAVALSGFTTLEQEDPRGGVERERAALEARVAAIEADPRHRDRELLRAPRVGTLARQIDELEEFRGPLAEVLARAQHPRLERLLESGYGTEAYDVGWWRASYYRDWKAADEILELFPAAKSFAEARAEIQRARESLAVYDAKLRSLRAEVEAGEALERELEAARGRLASLEGDHLNEWRGRLADHLSSLDPAVLGDRLAAEPDIALLLKQAFGLERKMGYLDEIVASQLAPLRKALADERQKLQRDLAKYARPKNARLTMPREQFEKRFQQRPTKIRKSFSRASHTYHTVHHFDRWDRGRLVEDFLWWDLMTDGRVDGDFIPEVRQYREAHPDRPWGLSADDESAAAAAALASDDARAELVDAS